MSHDLAGMDIEDMTLAQITKLFKGARTMCLLSCGRGEEQQEKDTEEAATANDDLVNLKEESKGKSKAPKVKADDLPEGVDLGEEEEEEEEAAPKKKGKK